ncbi:MAG: hypothetical protein OXI22_21890 [Defluviicoccus sp.]|nr:hypothetical protein [Defluviicoccus sp.]MDE0386546.1 hypothetical protein [Defluviicoccus sp.]
MTRPCGGPAALALALFLALPGDGRADWQRIGEADSRIVFAGRQLDAYRPVWRYLPFAASAYRHERYMAQWRAAGRRLPVLWVQLQLLAPGRYFPGGLQRSLARYARDLAWFREAPFAAGESGTAESALGEARYLVFASGGRSCAVFSLYADDGFADEPDTLGNTFMSGVYCPVSGEVDGAAVGSVVARLGIRGMAVPAPETRAARLDPGERLAGLVIAGDIGGLRAMAATGLDPDRAISFRHPRFASGRTIRRPMLMAAALFGHAGIVAFLLERGAATSGPAAAAICAAVAMDRRAIVGLLLERDPALARYPRCGPDGTRSALEVAMRLGHLDIAEALREAGG